MKRFGFGDLKWAGDYQTGAKGFKGLNRVCATTSGGAKWKNAQSSSLVRGSACGGTAMASTHSDGERSTTVAGLSSGGNKS
ncbi:hypothetical protein U1Q18_023523 [Sarracenia purpurea var. burkii]